MNPYALLISAVLAFGAGWQVQAWRYDARDNAQAEQQAQAHTAATQEARRIEQSRSRNIQEAQNAATLRNRTLLADADRARTESERLRGDIAAIARLPDESAAARAEHPRAAGELLAECSRSYQELAGKADGHANDAVTIRSAWPK
jgi:hypothetical protein